MVATSMEGFSQRELALNGSFSKAVSAPTVASLLAIFFGMEIKIKSDISSGKSTPTRPVLSGALRKCKRDVF